MKSKLDHPPVPSFDMGIDLTIPSSSKVNNEQTIALPAKNFFSSISQLAKSYAKEKANINGRRGANFSGAPRSLNLGAFFGVRARAMGSKKTREKLVLATGTNLQSGKDLPKGDGMECKLTIIKKDPEKLENMKVGELRTMLRNFGASAKGRKPELISSLKCLLDGKVNGENSVLEDGEAEVSQETNTVYTEIISRGRQKKQLVSRTSRVQQSNKEEPSLADVDPEDLNAEGIVMSEKSVTETIELPGKRPSSKRKLTIETSSKQIEASIAVKNTGVTNEPWTIFAHKKPQKDWVAYNPRTMRPPPLDCNVEAVKIMSWNVNGLRALLKFEGFSAVELAAREDFDILRRNFRQEKDVNALKDLLEGYEHSFWTCSISKPGYSGTSIVSRVKPLSVKYGLGISDHDSEGRLVTAEFDSFYLLNAYVPNSGDGLRRLSYRVTEWDASLSSYMKELEKSKPVILTGDLNCAHQEIDIYNPAGNKRSAGFTDEERQSFEKCYLSNGFVDTFRKQHPGVVGYTYWGYRHGGRKTNRGITQFATFGSYMMETPEIYGGWRLDYFLVSQSISDNVHDSFVLPDINGSDHCPIGLVLKL
ncbi:hypothetical protein V2J09_016005 [Rumex salicifolius]